MWIFAAILLAVTTVPYLLGYWAQNKDWVFNGFVFGVEDGNSYIAKMLEGASGDWLFRTPYTAYPQTGALAFFPYLLLGKLAAGPAEHEQLVFLFQLFRWVGGFLLIFATYDFVALFIKKVNYRRLATGLITAGGGLGWLSVVLPSLWGGRIPLEFYSPETFGFLSVVGLPHLAVARACLLWGIRDYLVNLNDFSIKRAAKGGLLWLAMGLFQPLTVLVGWVVIGCHFLVTGILKNLANLRKVDLRGLFKNVQKSFFTTVLIVLISSPIAIYSFFSFQRDPILRGWTDQNLILSPPFGDYLLAFLNVLPFSLAGIVLAARRRNWEAALLAIWLLIFPALAYAPYNLQRRLPEGVWAAIVILALIYIEEKFSTHRRIVSAWSAAAFLASLLFFAGAIFTTAKPADPLFSPAAEIAAFNGLQVSAVKNEVVLSSFAISNDLPAWLPVRTVIGHGPESVNASLLTPQVENFFKASTPDSDRLDLINEFGIKYVILGPEEQAPGCWNPQQSNFTQLFYQNSAYKIFQLTPGVPASWLP